MMHQQPGGHEEEETDWRIRERVEELKGKLQLRTRDKHAIFALSSQNIKENEDRIKKLQEELKKILAFKNDLTGPFAEQHIIMAGLRGCKRSQLALKRKTVLEALEAKREHYFEKVKQFNSLLYKRTQCEKKLNDLKEQTSYIQPDADIDEITNFEQRKRVISTTIDKMVLKLSSAKYVQKVYKQIIFRLEKDCMEQPRKLRRLEARVKQLRKEINTEFLITLQSSKEAYMKAKKDKESLETTILKEKQARDKSIGEMRQKFKNIKILNSFEERELKLRKQKTIFHFDEPKPAEVQKISGTSTMRGIQSFGSVDDFEDLKAAMDNLLDITCVPSLSHVSDCLKLQARKTEVLKRLIADLLKKRKHFMHIKEKCTNAVEEEKLTHRSALDEMKCCVKQTKLTISAKEKQKVYLKEKLMYLEDILSRVTETIKELRVKINSWDLAALKNEEEESEIAEQEQFDVMEILEYCEGRLVEINGTAMMEASYRSLGNMAMEFLQTLREIEAHERTFDVLVNLQSGSGKNSRIGFGFIQNFYMENFLFHDHDDNDEYLSRDAIKQMGSHLVKAKTATSKRKKKQKALANIE